ncbi:MAG: C4-dicarboxylate ABC transporter [Desulfobacteraceae bacterium 4484_190.1]|nr:MAG: C4-dicarboxylate ABC transporter [Desulfobacteraceae bacterium 4484_190.1]
MPDTKANAEKEVKKTKRLSGLSYVLTAIISAFAILLCINQLFHVNIAGFMPIGNAYYYYILTCYLSISFLIYPANKKPEYKIPWYDWVLFAVCVIDTIYLASNAYNILTRGWEYKAPLLPTIAGAVLWLLALEGVRRAGGFGLFVVCLVFSFYPLYAIYMPGFLWGPQFSFTETIRYHSMGVESIIGIPTRVVGNLLVGFLIFGVAIVSTGGGKFFMDFAMSLLGHTRGGAAKVSVLSSAFMASLSGSVISNVVTTGSVTIPAMKKTGYSPTWAGAVEACASTGGTIMPPIMGAAGFLIASFLNVPYISVMWAAFFPAFLYYLTLILQVDSHAACTGLTGLQKEELPQFWATLKNGWFYLGSLVLLIFILMYMRTEAWAPFYVMIFLFACAMIRKETRFTWKTFIEFIVQSGKLLAQITAILAGIGLILGSLSGTGVANSFSRELVMLAQGNIVFLLVFGALTSFVLGIGMTVTACYVFLAIVLVPALVGVGLNEMGCHLFVLYWGCLSYITPPVALGAITAATISESNPLKTSFLSMRLGTAKYILPFLFVLSPAMILRGPLFEVLLAVITAILGCILLACALEGYLYFYGKFSYYLRVPIFISGFLLLYPYWIADIIGFAILIIVVFIIKSGLAVHSKGQTYNRNQV